MAEAKTTTRSPVIEAHLKRYLETDGAEGHIVGGSPTLLLTTTGRKTGEQRITPLIYGRDGDNYLIVASQGGKPVHPNWYHNLVANPDVRLQVIADKFAARARTATEEEKPRLWKIMTSIYPPYDEYQTRTTRVIPLVILEPKR
jgi:deazaflavin-dependent oxidoreductase (nitroreductase family)